MADNSNPYWSFVLDVVDKIIEFAAVVIGAIWTFRNYKKSRTYEQKLDIQTVGTVSTRQGIIFLDVQATARNIGATVHTVEKRGTYCDVIVVREDLSEEIVYTFRSSRLKVR